MSGATPPPPPGTPPPPPPGSPPPPPFGQDPPPPPGGPGAPPPGYPQYPPYGAPQQEGNGLAVASLVLGIISIPFCLFVLPGLLAVIFGAIALNKCKQNPNVGGRGKALAGTIMGAISIGVFVLLLAFGEWSFDVESLVLPI